MYLLKLAFRPWRLAPLSQMFSAISVGFLLLLVGFLFWMQQGLKPILIRLHGEQVVTAYLEPSVESGKESQIVDSIRLTTGAHPLPEIRLVTADLFLQQLKGQHKDLARELEDLGPEMNQVIPRYVSVSGILPQATLEKIRNIPGVESAESSKDRYRHIVGAFSALRWVARVLMVGIFLALLTGLIHLARTNAYLHRDALTLLRFWGAGNTALASPGMVSGVVVGVLGGLIALSAWLSLGVWLAKHVRSLSPMLQGMPEAQSQLALILLIAGGGLGFVSGLIGSLTASHLADEKGS